jgi:hypothetical protein
MTKSKTGVTKAELDDLKAVGFVEGDKNTIPSNISPVLKSKLLKAMGENDAGNIPGVPAEGNEAVQKAGRHHGQQFATNTEGTSKPAEDTKSSQSTAFGGKGDHDNDGRVGGTAVKK